MRISKASRLALPFEAERRALDLLVVLEFDLKELDHLDRDARGAGDANRGEFIALIDLVHVALSDDVAHRGAAIAGENHPGGVGDRDDRRAVRARRWAQGSGWPVRGGQEGSSGACWPRKSLNEEFPAVKNAAGTVLLAVLLSVLLRERSTGSACHDLRPECAKRFTHGVAGVGAEVAAELADLWLSAARGAVRTR